MARRKKTIEIVVTVSCPAWLTKAQARQEVRTLINEQAFYGHVNRNPHALQQEAWEEIDQYNFRARKVK